MELLAYVHVHLHMQILTLYGLCSQLDAATVQSQQIFSLYKLSSMEQYDPHLEILQSGFQELIMLPTRQSSKIFQSICKEGKVSTCTELLVTFTAFIASWFYTIFREEE